MLKDYLKEQQISIYSLSKKTKIPYSTLSDLCNGKVDIDNSKVSILIQLSKELNIGINKLYEICKTNNEIKVEQYDTTGQLIVKNKKYYVQ